MIFRCKAWIVNFKPHYFMLLLAETWLPAGPLQFPVHWLCLGLLVRSRLLAVSRLLGCVTVCWLCHGLRAVSRLAGYITANWLCHGLPTVSRLTGYITAHGLCHGQFHGSRSALIAPALHDNPTPEQRQLRSASSCVTTSHYPTKLPIREYISALSSYDLIVCGSLR